MSPHPNPELDPTTQPFEPGDKIVLDGEAWDGYTAVVTNTPVESDICPDCAGWGDERGTFGYCKSCDGTGRVNH